MRDYSLTNFFSTGIALVITKISFPKARLIRRPFYLRGKKGVKYGNGLTTGHACRFDASNKKITLVIGENARFGDYVHINADESIMIGKNILTASKVFISDTNHGNYKGDFQTRPDTNPTMRDNFSEPVKIGDNVWIGENAVILPGSNIGNGCIIGANTLINGGTYPDNSMIVGSPGKIIKLYNNKTGKWERVK